MIVGAVASAINAVAGGGSLLSFPTLRFVTALPPTIANATNSVALWPGSLGGAFGFRNLFEKTKKHLAVLLLPTILGSAVGAYLMVATSSKIFDRIVPWLILFAAVLLLIQPALKKWLVQDRRTVVGPAAGWIMQFLVSIYGGYFGAGMGIMMLAAFSFYLDGTIHELNAIKNALGLIINLTCSVIFLSQHLIQPQVALILTAGSIAGGFGAAKASQRIDPEKLRSAIAVYGVGMAAYYLFKAWS